MPDLVPFDGNILAHIYEIVDDERILTAIKQNLNDFEEFIRLISLLTKKTD